MKNSISQKFITKSLLMFTLPSMIMMVFCSVYAMSGSIYASHFIGQNAMSAINIIFPLYNVMLAVAIMFATGANAIISKNMGEGDLKKARENFTVISVLGILVGLLLTVLTLIFSEQIVAFLGGAEVLLYHYSKDYLVSVAFVFPLQFLRIYSQYFFVTIGKPVIGMVAEIIGGFANIILGYIFVAVLKIGIVGISLGQLAGCLVPTLIFVSYFFIKKVAVLHFVKPKLHKRFVFDTCTNGSSEMVTNLAVAVVTAVLNAIILRMEGIDGLAAVSVIVQVQFLLSSMYIGYGAGVAPVFGFAYGEDNREQTKTVFRISQRFIAISSLALVVICLIFSENIVSWFINPESSAYSLGITGFKLFSFGYIFAGMNIFASVFFTSVSNGKISALISFLRTFAFILGMLLILPPMIGTVGVWLAIPIAEMLSIIVVIFMFKKYKNTYHY